MKNILFLITLITLGITSCNKEVHLQAIDGNPDGSDGGDILLVDKGNPQSKETILAANGSYSFTFTTSTEAPKNETLAVDKSGWDELLKEYNRYMKATEYALLPDANFEVNPVEINKGSKSADINVVIKNMSDLPQGFYLLPLKMVYLGQPVLRMLRVNKDASYSPLSSTSKKPMLPGTYNCPNRTEPMKMVAYVETNNWDIRNMGQFILKDSKKPVFDYVILFAANMNYDLAKKKRYLFFNDKFQPMLRDPKRYFQPLKDRGIKVIIDILPNHQGVGYNNFQSYEDALDFARDCKEWADKLGIDGYDIDEEYADYYVQPELTTKGAKSTLWFMRAMKEVMPDKLLTLYDYGHSLSASSRDEWGKGPVDYLDFSVSDYYVTSPSSVGLPSNKYGSRSFEATRSGRFDFASTYNINYIRDEAMDNAKDCNGYHMIFNLKGTSIKDGNAAKTISAMTQVYYGEDTEFSGNYYPGPDE